MDLVAAVAEMTVARGQRSDEFVSTLLQNDENGSIERHPLLENTAKYH